MSKKKKKSRSKKGDQIKSTLKYEISGLSIFGFSAIAMAKLGAVGTSFVFLSRFFMGEWYILLLLGLMVFGVLLMWKREIPFFFKRQLVGIYFIILAILLSSHIILFENLSSNNGFTQPSVILNTWEIFWMELQGTASTIDLGGGMIGAILYAVFHFLFADAGSKFISFLLIVAGLILITGKGLSDSIGKVLGAIGRFIVSQWKSFMAELREPKTSKNKNKNQKAKSKSESVQASSVLQDEGSNPEKEDTLEERIISNFADRAYLDEEIDDKKNDDQISKPNDSTEAPAEPVPHMNFTEVENVDYKLPKLSLLKSPKKADQSGEYELIHTNAEKLESTFKSFGVKARVTQVHLGPAVTKYEVHPDVGVKVSKIVSLSDDLALALAAKDIRIEAPIPGKSAIGIEVPNSDVAVVSLREVLEVQPSEKSGSKLLIALGRDISGEAVSAELNKMPHLLVAGATGSGKSVCINGIITSVLMRAKPHEVKMMMIDPKMVELNVYNGIPHLLAPVVTDPKKAAQALKKVVMEMERRYELFSHSGTRNIEGYNDLVTRQNLEEGEKNPLLPYIIVIVDELADLMMVASSEVEDAITRLAQMARAAGIHLIIATQRPSVDVITGVIKANIPSRIAFSVSSQIDSRTILDMGGAEKLLGRGDMLFLPVGASKPVRVQGAFLSDQEVEDVVDFVISQQRAQYQENMIPDEVQETVSESTDDLYDEAVKLIADMQTASVSMLQRRFRIGYTRAARLIDEMEARGVVGPYEGSKPRTVLVPKDFDQASNS
ncbi:DNA translocase FtsK [Pradoshia sp. D12]|uniref:DNA translocase FtsK n=1 Tax=Bacillaceae TaxID=186817 RepID=UPI00112BF3E2|nr:MULTISPECIES: DNA translocase FtsK [Bacillaceae]QFK71038.1 DNA translocase FtsK [Pradoshia sp. D12]TPF72831.1 DNA translocase FtsK [Bacillus sp. D12]